MAKKLISWAELHEHHQGSAETHPGRVQGTPQAVVRGLQRCHLRSETLGIDSHLVDDVISSDCDESQSNG